MKFYFKINDKVLRYKDSSSQYTDHKCENVNFLFVPNCSTFHGLINRVESRESTKIVLSM